jgi:hypothetical protein
MFVSAVGLTRSRWWFSCCYLYTLNLNALFENLKRETKQFVK